MGNIMERLSNSEKRHILVEAAKRSMQEQGYTMERVPGRGLSNIWNITRDDKTQIASIRTTQNRRFAFPPLKGGTAWKTLDDVQLVIVASVDDHECPECAEVYVFPSDEVRKCFNAAYTARINAGQSLTDNFGMWLSLDRDDQGIAASVGSGIIEKYKCVASYQIKDLIADKTQYLEDNQEDIDKIKELNSLTTIADIMSWARQHIADIAAVEFESVKLELKIEH